MRKILFICGSLNQTTMMHEISRHFPNDECYFSAYYGDGIINQAAQKGILDFSILGGKFRRNTEKYFNEHNLRVDYRGLNNNYDLVFTCADLIIPKNIRNKKVILVQEGMTDPETIMYYLVRYLRLPRWLASTSMNGLSNLFNYFCVASEGYREHFIRKGVKPEKIIVTGIPNFDNAKQFIENDFPYKNYALVCTSDARETFKLENRKKFIKECVEMANGKQIIFKLHPNEKVERATKEINKYAPGAIVIPSGKTDHMIANCDVLITKYSSVVYIGLVLDKEVHSYFNLEELKKMVPIQNGGTSAEKIARVGKQLMEPNAAKSSFEEIKHLNSALS